VNRLDDIDLVWGFIQEEAAKGPFDLPDRFPDRFKAAFVDLREVAHRPVNIDHPSVINSILGEAIGHIDNQIDAYSTALASHLANPGDISSLNDLLRISYNFADGSKDLLNLIIGVSDMKPIIFWLTCGAQLELSIQLSQLPFVLNGSKPSLDRYRSTIAGARNHTFHNIFAFGRPFRVRLTGDAFRSAELHLFREYAKRNDSPLSYADRRLVDLLQGFTRAAESPVPLDFWESNLDVMQAVKRVALSLRSTLVTLFENSQKT
jgi:hypothetical protein